jgi:hypothetical protein
MVEATSAWACSEVGFLSIDAVAGVRLTACESWRTADPDEGVSGLASTALVTFFFRPGRFFDSTLTVFCPVFFLGTSFFDPDAAADAFFDVFLPTFVAVLFFVVFFGAVFFATFFFVVFFAATFFDVFLPTFPAVFFFVTFFADVFFEVFAAADFLPVFFVVFFFVVFFAVDFPVGFLTTFPVPAFEVFLRVVLAVVLRATWSLPSCRSNRFVHMRLQHETSDLGTV